MGDKRGLARKAISILMILILSAGSPLSLGVSVAAEENKEVTKEAPITVSAEVPAAVKEPPVQIQPQPQEAAKPVESIPVAPGNVTVNFKGADIRTVLSYISEVAGIDIVAAPDVKGIIDLKLTDKPWKAALDIIARNYGYAYDREGDIIRVVTLDKLKQEELTTQTFNLNYSKAKDVVASVKNIVGDRGKVMYDERTNILLVTDIPTNIYKIAQVIERLDKRTPQILIEARVIETVLGDDEKLGIDWNVKIAASGAKRPITFPFDFFDVDSKMLTKFLPFSQTQVPTVVTAGGTTQSQAVAPADFPLTTSGPNNQKNFPFALKDDFKFGTLDFSELKAVLELLKSRSDTDTISNPRIATINNYKATINVGETINMPKFERNSTTGKMEITGYEEKDAGIILDVVPHVNDKDEIALELLPQISDFQGFQPIAPGSDIYAPLFRTRQAKTQVVVGDGQTIFIGGLISERDVDRRTKLPFIGDLFGDVPYIGLLVSHKDIVKQRVELIFFITVHLMVPDKEIAGSPLPCKAYIPVYTDTQRGNTAKSKKRLKKTY